MIEHATIENINNFMSDEELDMVHIEEPNDKADVLFKLIKAVNDKHKERLSDAIYEITTAIETGSTEPLYDLASQLRP